LDSVNSVVLTKSKIALSKINALSRPVRDKIRSDQQTDKTGSIMSPKRRTLWGTPTVRVSAGQQHIGSGIAVKQDFTHFCKIFSIQPALSASRRVNAKSSTFLRIS